MSHITLCDRCYRKTTASIRLTIGDAPSELSESEKLRPQSIDLCLDCKVRFDEWMKSAKTVERTMLE